MMVYSLISNVLAFRMIPEVIKARKVIRAAFFIEEKLGGAGILDAEAGARGRA
jgi:hypothetical protein